MINFKENKIEFDIEIFQKLLYLSPNSLSFLFKILNFRIEQGKLPRWEDLTILFSIKEFALKTSLEEILNLMPDFEELKIYSSFLEEYISKPFKPLGGEIEQPNKISITKSNISKKLRHLVVEPYIEELIKRGYGKFIHSKFKANLIFALMQVVSQYKEVLSPKDVLAILLSALDNEYFKSIGKTTDVYLIFLNKKTSLVEKYLRENKILEQSKENIPVINFFGEKQDISEYGYFDILNNKYIFIPPKNKNAMYFKILKEVENRLVGIKDINFNDLFNEDLLKPEESWRIGNRILLDSEDSNTINNSQN
jgi:hypothetical protein